MNPVTRSRGVGSQGALPRRPLVGAGGAKHLPGGTRKAPHVEAHCRPQPSSARGSEVLTLSRVKTVLPVKILTPPAPRVHTHMLTHAGHSFSLTSWGDSPPTPFKTPRKKAQKILLTEGDGPIDQKKIRLNYFGRHNVHHQLKCMLN